MSLVPAADKAESIERVVIQGDLAKLQPQERVDYYRLVCESVGLNPLTKPFEYITLNGKLTLYARKDATDQLRSIHQVSVRIVDRSVTEGCYVVTAQASFPSGRVDESIGAVPIENLKGEARANAMMKCETKAKRRVTLSACGLGMLDETEIETIPSARADVQTPRITESIPISRNPVMEAAQVSSDAPGKASEHFPEKVADKPLEGPSPAGAQAPPMREPGSDDGDDFESATKLAELVIAEKLKLKLANAPTFIDEPIGLPKQRALHRAFVDAIPESAAEVTRKQGPTIFREWLKNQGYVGEDKQGSTKKIPEFMFDEVRKNAVEYARKLK